MPRSRCSPPPRPCRPTVASRTNTGRSATNPRTQPPKQARKPLSSRRKPFSLAELRAKARAPSEPPRRVSPQAAQTGPQAERVYAVLAVILVVCESDMMRGRGGDCPVCCLPDAWRSIVHGSPCESFSPIVPMPRETVVDGRHGEGSPHIPHSGPSASSPDADRPRSEGKDFPSGDGLPSTRATS
jgi:hypothetical protein